jgi:flagellar biosynthetic protein FliP
MAMTPMVRLLVVFHFLRQALGTQTAPSNPTLMGLALMMTWFLMTPVLNQVDQQAVEPYRAGQVTGWEAIDRGAAGEDLPAALCAGEGPGPVYRRRAGAAAQHAGRPAHAGGGAGLHLSELKAGFSIGAVLFLPFLIDRHGDGLGDHLDRHVSAAAGGGLDAAEDSAVCDGGRLEPAGRIAVEELLNTVED